MNCCIFKATSGSFTYWKSQLVEETAPECTEAQKLMVVNHTARLTLLH